MFCVFFFLHVQPFCPPGWSWSWEGELHAASQRGRPLLKGQWGQHDRQPLPPAGQEAQSEEEEMSRDSHEATGFIFAEAVVFDGSVLLSAFFYSD